MDSFEVSMKSLNGNISKIKIFLCRLATFVTNKQMLYTNLVVTSLYVLLVSNGKWLTKKGIVSSAKDIAIITNTTTYAAGRS